MTMTAIVAVVGAYVGLAVLLLSLNIASLWRWWIKAGAIVLTTIVFVGTYVAITALLGWPTDQVMPTRFSLISTRVVEPDHLRNTPGHVYLWLEEIDEEQVIIGAPRAYEVPFTVKLAEDVATAQEQLDGGTQIMGQYATEQKETGERQAPPNQAPADVAMAGNLNQEGHSTGEGGILDNSNMAATLTFSDMPPVTLPVKIPVIFNTP